MMNFQFVGIFLVILIALAGKTAQAEISVIVHTSNNSSIDSVAIQRIFLGKAKKFSSGESVVPINQEEGSEGRLAFQKNILKKSSSQLKAYWSKLVFTGKGTPPKDVGSGEVKKLIATNPNMIGYINSTDVDDSVKVVSTF